MRNAVESSLPEVLINRTSYSLSGRLKFSTPERRKVEKENISQGFLGAFDSFMVCCLILGRGDSPGRGLLWHNVGGTCSNWGR